MNFSQIPGQKAVIDRLRISVTENRVSHALLFYGPEGSGKFAIALAFARYISCEKRTAGQRICMAYVVKAVTSPYDAAPASTIAQPRK